MCVLTSLEIIEDVRLVRAITYSSYTLLVWDYLLTLDDEMTYIWKSPFSLVKCFFIGNRYLNLLAQPVSMSQISGVLPLHSNTACLGFSLGMALYQFLSYGSVHILVLLRVWILNGRTRKITVALGVMLTIYVCAFIGLIAYILGATTFRLHGGPSGTCVVRLARFSWLIWVAEFILEVCLFALMILTLRRQTSTSELSRVSWLVRSLYAHAAIFLLANTLGDIPNIITWAVFLKTPLYHIANTLPITLVNITGQRLAIDLRRLHIQKKVTWSQLSREVEHQLAAFGNDPVVP